MTLAASYVSATAPQASFSQRILGVFKQCSPFSLMLAAASLKPYVFQTCRNAHVQSKKQSSAAEVIQLPKVAGGSKA